MVADTQRWQNRFRWPSLPQRIAVKRDTLQSKKEKGNKEGWVLDGRMNPESLKRKQHEEYFKRDIPDTRSGEEHRAQRPTERLSEVYRDTVSVYSHSKYCVLGGQSPVCMVRKSPPSPKVRQKLFRRLTPRISCMQSASRLLLDSYLTMDSDPSIYQHRCWKVQIPLAFSMRHIGDPVLRRRRRALVRMYP